MNFNIEMTNEIVTAIRPVAEMILTGAARMAVMAAMLVITEWFGIPIE